MKLFLFLFSTLFFLQPSFSQSSDNDEATGLQVKNAIALYDKYTAANAPVYNGEQYEYYTFKMEGDPFFETNQYTAGWVSYQGRIYDSLPMIYDVVRNQLVVLSPDHISRIVIMNRFVDSFSLSNHTFISLAEDHKKNLYNPGFYDLLYSGNAVQFLERHVKEMVSTIPGNVLVTVFRPKNRYYVHKKELYYLVSNKKDAFRVFGDKLHDLKKMMRQKHLKIKRKNFETAMIKLTAFYDQLTH